MMRRSKESVYAVMPKVHRYAVCVLVTAVFLWVCEGVFSVYVGASESVHGKVFVVVRDAQPKLGDLAVFTSGDDHPVLRGRTLIKYVGALPGARITAHKYYIEVSKRKLFLEGERAPLHQSRVPEGMVFVFGTHPFSLDSRYACVGLLPLARCAGVVRVIIA